jgi:predicted DNA-binding protein (MmcQ/YjbR family)
MMILLDKRRDYIWFHYGIRIDLSKPYAINSTFKLRLSKKNKTRHMNIEDIQLLCRKMPAVTEDIKWGNDLVFSVGGKMFCVLGLDQSPTSASFKVTDEEFEEMCNRPGFKPAPYVAKYKWVLVDDINKMKKSDWKHYLQQSYELVKDKLTAKLKKQLGLGENL